MNVPVREVKAAQRLAIVDCDIHPVPKTPKDVYQFLPQRWREHVETFGSHIRHALTGQLPYPRMMASGMRTDSFPEDGDPGSDLPLMQSQHLDPNGVQYGMLTALSRGGMEERNLDLGAALSHAVNEWQVEYWVKPEPRLRAAIVVPQENAEAAVAEIERRASDPAFVQISLSPRSSQPIGQRHYWPIYAAAERVGKPLAMHVAGYGGGNPQSGSGWPTYYMQDHYAMTTNMQNNVVSLIFEGVFDRFPGLKVVMIEGGFAWVPSLAWRMDKVWERMRAEVPHVKRPPSEYLRENFWFTTQPIEEPQTPEHLRDICEWVGWDRLMFSTDYPHWDFDNPALAFKFALTREEKDMVFRDNAKKLYGLQ
jgi:predicted TIM-barrel fold metal-dependent hydrolase